MTRLLIASIAALALGAGLQSSAHAAENDMKFIGLWQEELDGRKVVWSIGYWNNTWSVLTALHKSGEPAASWQGTDVRLADGKLTFTQKRGKNAPATVKDGTKVTLQIIKDGELAYTWEDAGSKGGPRTLTRCTEVALAPDARPAGDNAPAVVVDVPAKPPGDKPVGKPPTDKPAGKPSGRTMATAEDAKRFGGMWAGEADGFKEVWNIRFEDGKCILTAVYADPKGKRASFGMTGADIEFKEDKLHFIQKLGPGAPGHWSKNHPHTVEATPDGLSYSYFGGGRSLAKVPAAAIEAAFLGSWTCEVDGFLETWLIRKTGSKLQVGASVAAPGKRRSSWIGQDVKLADGKLTFTQKFRLAPPMGWEDKSQFTLEWNGAELICNWVNGDKKGETRYLRLVSK